MSYPQSKRKYYADAYDRNLFDFTDYAVKNLPGLLSGTLMAFIGDPLNPGTLSAGSEINPTGASGSGVGGVRPSKKGLLKKISRPVSKSVAKAFEGVDDYDEAMKIAQRGDHLKRDKSGKYIGAPFDETGNYRSVTSPQGLSSMRKEVDKQVEEGMFNYDWYDRARDVAETIAPGDPTM